MRGPRDRAPTDSVRPTLRPLEGSVAEHEPPALVRGDTRPGEEDAHEVQRIGRMETHHVARALLAAHATQAIHRVGQRVLLADEAGHEPTAPHEAPGLAAAEGPQHVAPREREALTLRELT